MDQGLLGFPPGRGIYRRQVFLSSQQWSVPAGCKNAKVLVLGGGASIGGCGWLGGPGGAAIKNSLRLTPGEIVQVTVAPATNGGGGINGGASSFGRYLSATGGISATGSPTCGVGTGGDYNSVAAQSFHQYAIRSGATNYTMTGLFMFSWADFWSSTTTPPIAFPGAGTNQGGGFFAGQGLVVVEWFEDFTP